MVWHVSQGAIHKIHEKMIMDYLQKNSQHNNNDMWCGHGSGTEVNKYKQNAMVLQLKCTTLESAERSKTLTGLCK